MRIFVIGLDKTSQKVIMRAVIYMNDSPDSRDTDTKLVVDLPEEEVDEQLYLEEAGRKFFAVHRAVEQSEVGIDLSRLPGFVDFTQFLREMVSENVNLLKKLGIKRVELSVDRSGISTPREKLAELKSKYPDLDPEFLRMTEDRDAIDERTLYISEYAIRNILVPQKATLEKFLEAFKEAPKGGTDEERFGAKFGVPPISKPKPIGHHEIARETGAAVQAVIGEESDDAAKEILDPESPGGRKRIAESIMKEMFAIENCRIETTTDSKGELFNVIMQTTRGERWYRGVSIFIKASKRKSDSPIITLMSIDLQQRRDGKYVINHEVSGPLDRLKKNGTISLFLWRQKTKLW